MAGPKKHSEQYLMIGWPSRSRDTALRPVASGRWWRRSYVVFLAAAWFLLVPRVALAISLGDIVRMSDAGYTDQAIIDLIEVTESRFILDPETLVKLKEEGVSEAVMEALIDASDPAREPLVPESRSSPDRPAADQAEQEHGHARPIKPSRAGVPRISLSEQTQPGSCGFSTFPFEETTSGHGSSHQHYALTINEVPILILRSEAGFPKIAERAWIVANILNQNVHSVDGSFVAEHSPEPTVWYRGGSSSEPVLVLNVSRSDVIAYQRRSVGQVSADRLAAYWAALLDDYTRLFLFGHPPRQLVGLHLGETLGHIYENVNSLASEPGDTGSPADLHRLLGLIDHLSTDDKEHLIELSSRVPIEFEGP